MKKTIITVVGKDTVGIIAKVCTYLAETKVNILDISQTIMQDIFTMIMLVDIFLGIGRSTNLVVINSMRAAGDIQFPTVLGIVSMWGVSALFAFILGIGLGWGLVGVWIAMAADEILRGIIVFARWIKGSWRGKSVVSND